MYKVDIIIVNYKNSALLEKCLSSIEKSTYKDYKIHIVDNTDNNVGPAIAFNSDLKDCKGEYIVFMAADMEIENDFLQKIVWCFDDFPNIGAITPKIYDGYSKRLDYIGAYLTWTGFLIYRQQGHREDIGQFDYPNKVTCNAMAFRKSILDKLNGFDEDYFMYLEDTDLCIRTILLGYEVWYLPHIVIHHWRNSGINRNPHKDFIINYYGCRNYIITLLKNLSLKNLLIILPIHISLWLIFGLIKGRLNYYLSAMADIIKNWNKIMERRRKIQSMRKVSDQALLIKFPTWRMLWGKIMKLKK